MEKYISSPQRLTLAVMGRISATLAAVSVSFRYAGSSIPPILIFIALPISDGSTFQGCWLTRGFYAILAPSRGFRLL
ncbi:hypothetical protein ACFLW8_06085 [Chloroflexota bacterium]